MAVLKGQLPWWSIPVNWTIGLSNSICFADTIATITYSYLGKPRRKSFFCGHTFQGSVPIFHYSQLRPPRHMSLDDGLIVSDPYATYIRNFVV